MSSGRGMVAGRSLSSRIVSTCKSATGRSDMISVASSTNSNASSYGETSITKQSFNGFNKFARLGQTGWFTPPDTAVFVNSMNHLSHSLLALAAVRIRSPMTAWPIALIVKIPQL